MIKVTGDNVRAVLSHWPDVINHRVIQAANAEAAMPLIMAAHRLAPVGNTGNLADSIGTEKPGMSRANVIGEVKVGPRRGKFKGNHAHLNEYGTRSRSTRSGANRGVMPAKPFMGPAFLQTKEQVLSSINGILGRKVTGYMRRKLKTHA